MRPVFTCHEADGQVCIWHKQAQLYCKVKQLPQVGVKIRSIHASEVSFVDVGAEIGLGKERCV